MNIFQSNPVLNHILNNSYILQLSKSQKCTNSTCQSQKFFHRSMSDTTLIDAFGLLCTHLFFEKGITFFKRPLLSYADASNQMYKGHDNPVSANSSRCPNLILVEIQFSYALTEKASAG